VEELACFFTAPQALFFLRMRHQTKKLTMFQRCDSSMIYRHASAANDASAICRLMTASIL
jgi:hypothetical protein